MLSEQFNSMTIANRRSLEYHLPIIQNPSSASMVPESIRNQPSRLKETLRMSLKQQKVYLDDQDSIEADFYRHIDRKKSKGGCTAFIGLDI